MKKTNTSITVASPQTKDITIPPTVPPPRRKDVIEAMLIRARAKREEELKEYQEKRKAAKDKLDVAVTEHLEKSPSDFERRVSVSSWGVEVKFELLTLPPSVTKLRKAWNDIPNPPSFCEDTVKRKIRERVEAQEERVSAILNNAAAVKAIDSLLETI